MASFLDFALPIATVAGSYLASQSAGRAADAQVQAQGQSNELLRRIYEQGRLDLAPQLAVGEQALYGISDQLGVARPTQPLFAPQFPDGSTGMTATQGYTASPGYQFQLDEGNKAIERSNAARGRSLSPAAVKDLQRFSTGLAAQDYGNYANRLLSLAGLTPTSTAAAGALGQNYAGQAGAGLAGVGEARAAGQIGRGNAISSGIENLLLASALRG